MTREDNKSKEQLIQELSEARALIDKLQARIDELQPYESMVEQSAAMVLMADTDRRIKYVNPRFVELTGYSVEEAQQMETRRLGDMEDKAEQARMLALLNSGQNWRGEFHNMRKSGEWFWTMAAIAPLRSNEGEITHYLSIQEDITARKEAEQKLRESEERFRTLMAKIPDGVGLSIGGRAVYGNEALAKILGYTEEELAGKEIVSFLHPEDRARAAARIRALYENGDEYPSEYRMIRRNGSVVSVELSSRIIQLEGEQALLTVFHDLTERRRAQSAQSALLPLQKTESVGRLAGGVAHEFNNLLVAILGQTSLAKEKLPPKGAAIAHLNRALSAGERGADLMRQLLAYSGRGQYEIKPLHLNSLVQDNQHLYKLALRKNMQLEFDFASTLPPIRADAGQLQQAVMNLILNAADAIGDEPGTATVVTAMQSVQGDETELWQYTGVPLAAGDYVTLEVRDTGVGIPPEVLPSIFEPFFSTKNKRPGLGLAAVLGIVSAFNGGLQVTSRPTEGSTFKLLFPVDASDVAQAFDPARLLRRDVILVIDDDKDVRDTVTHILTAAGLRVISADEGNAGIQLYQKHAVEVGLVLLDWSMPGLSGEVTFHELRAVNPNVRVILSSGYLEPEATRRLLGKGLTGFMQKPYRADELVTEIRKFLDTK